MPTITLFEIIFAAVQASWFVSNRSAAVFSKLAGGRQAGIGWGIFWE